MSTYSIVVAAPGPSNSIRFPNHPVLESGNLSFPTGKYTLEFQSGSDRTSCFITHRINGAPLISRMLASGEALFACILSSPISSYRQTHTSSTARHEVCWNLDDLGEPPLFTPMILCTKPLEITLDASSDGLHSIWDGQSIALQKGSRLALGSVIQMETSITHLLSLREDTKMEDGQFCVEVETEPFHFVVNLSSRLHQYLRYNQTEHRHNIMTHIVTACLARLQRDFCKEDEDSDWKSYSSLVAFSDHLKDKELYHWTDDEFRPELAATVLYPHVLPRESAASDGAEAE